MPANTMLAAMGGSLSTAGMLTMLAVFATTPFNLFIKELQWPESSRIKNGTTFDIVIIGGGTAGSTLASRLSDIADWSVLLIEAGGNPPVQSSVPGLAFTLVNTNWDWTFQGENDKYSSQAVDGKAIIWPGGKMLGGSGSMNFMFYTQGCKADYDLWEDLGNEGWSWNDVKHYFKDFEKLDEKLLSSKRYLKSDFGSAGPLSIKQFDYPFHEIKSKLKAAYKEIGFPENKNFFSAEHPFGTGEILGVTENGKRASSASAFLLPVVGRPNLHIVKNAMVTEILIENGTAVGVQYSTPEENKTIFVRKEVVLSAGAFRTPQLLMISGIGDKSELDQLNIKTKVDLKVGKTLKDHILVPVYFYRKSTEPIGKTYEMLFQNIIKYARESSGLLATSLVSDLVTFFSINNSHQPEFEMVNLYSPVGSELAALSCLIGYKLPQQVCTNIAQLNLEHDVVVIHFVLLHSDSVGEVTLRNKNPFDNPGIKSGFFKNSTDLDHIANGMRMITKLAKSETFKSMGMKHLPFNLTECRGLKVGSEEYWKCTALNVAGSIYHPVGSAKMGLKSDPYAVVDNKLKVYGVNKLRIGDASVIPSQISGHTSASVMMIAQKLSDMIKNEHTSFGRRIKIH